MEENTKNITQMYSQNYDFFLECRLMELNKELADRHVCCMTVFERMLDNFLIVFPTFTDHSLLHTMNIINISNQLLRENILKLNASEIYIYLMACALHDVGMGVSDKDIDEFVDASGLRGYVDAHPEISKSNFIRKFHNDFSAQFVKKYWELLEIPNERYAQAIAEVGHGHRKTDLMDEELYPVSFTLGDGTQANLALLAALIRLCDELDVASDRNPKMLYDTDTMEGMSEKDVFEFSKHNAIHTVEFTENSIVIIADTNQAEIAEGISEAARTIGETLEYCLSVIDKCSDFKIDFEKVKLILNNSEAKI